MKKFAFVFCGLFLFGGPAVSEIVPDWYVEEQAEYSDDGAATGDQLPVASDQSTADNQPSVANYRAPVAPAVSPRTLVNRAGTRSSATAVGVNANGPRATNSRGIATRNTVAAPTQNQPVRAAAASRNVNANTTTAAGRNNTAPARAATARAGLLQTDTINTPLYNSSSRAPTGATNTVAQRAAATTTAGTLWNATGATPTARAASTLDVAAIDEVAQMTDLCRAQYYSCMDNFCGILDDNQGRCSCSSNIAQYQKAEDSLKDATEGLQDVARKIQYIGLTPDEVTSLFTQTEAEVAMSGVTDTSDIQRDLERLRKSIFDVNVASESSSGVLSFDLSDLNFDFSDYGIDLTSMFGGQGSISNQRGADLYRTASARCKASVLNSCQKSGIDIAAITNGYDLEIDKQCVAYERSLSDSTTAMRRTVKNAENVLQKARLMVTQQKNVYDLRGCVTAMDECMQTDFVCGSDYQNCVDPSGKYIVNGEIVAGSTPGQIIDSGAAQTTGLYATWENAWAADGNLGTFITNNLTNDGKTASGATSNIVKFLQSKIGYHDNSTGQNIGMCIAVLNKCQAVSYNTQQGSYNGKNQVVVEWMNRALVDIKATQDIMLNDYATTCRAQVRSCLNSSGATYVSDSTMTNGVRYVVPAASRAACSAVITTCKSVTGITNDEDLWNDSTGGNGENPSGPSYPLDVNWAGVNTAIQDALMLARKCMTNEFLAAPATVGTSAAAPGVFRKNAYDSCASNYVNEAARLIAAIEDKVTLITSNQSLYRRIAAQRALCWPGFEITGLGADMTCSAIVEEP